MPSFYFGFFIGLLCLFHCTTASVVTGRQLIEVFETRGTKEEVLPAEIPRCILDLSRAQSRGLIDNLRDMVTENFKMGYGNIDFDFEKTLKFFNFMNGKYKVDVRSGFKLQKATISGEDLTAYRITGHGKFTIETVQGMPEASDAKYENGKWYLVNKDSKLSYFHEPNLLLNHPSGLSLFVDHLIKQEINVPEEVFERLATFKPAQEAPEAQEAQRHNL